MTGFRCSKCKEIIYRDCRHREYKGRKRIFSYCDKNRIRAICTKIIREANNGRT
jgi:hypothetical protein